MIITFDISFQYFVSVLGSINYRWIAVESIMEALDGNYMFMSKA